MAATFWVVIEECSVAQGINGNKLILLDGSVEAAEQACIDASVAIRVGAHELEGALSEKNGRFMLSATRWVSEAEYTEIAQRVIAVRAGKGHVSVWLDVATDSADINDISKFLNTVPFSIISIEIIYQFIE
ncbi:hypothetical protein RIEGSTA812A_PEG_516 [invertebrate metagenome]|uniref:Uncharacterized protein n=1 Tax=invertebrate metagenome TaxID=1711999 RepID=A0A484H8H0_9ZZZZ